MRSIAKDIPYFKTQPQTRFVVYAIVALMLTVLNVLVLQLISFGGISPDLVLVMCVWVALAEGQFAAILFAFAVGLVFDIASADVLGSNALAKTLATFVAGYFYSQKTIQNNIASPRFIFILFLASIIHYFIYYTLYLRPSEIPFWLFMIKNGVSSTLYTTIFGTFPMFYFSRSMDRMS